MASEAVVRAGGRYPSSTRTRSSHAVSQLTHPTRHDRTDAYRDLLTNRPWQHCPCGICATAGIDVAIFRGSERNKRRGFHNLFVFGQRLQRQLARLTA